MGGPLFFFNYTTLIIFDRDKVNMWYQLIEKGFFFILDFPDILNKETF